MCLGIPGKIVEITGVAPFCTAKVNFGGAVKSGISLLACPDAKEGDYCLTHAGSALSIIDEKCARETMELLREYSAL
jgi:hydrogenase expression/formation protein HypC